MAAATAKEEGGVNKVGEEFVYRISTAEEWEALQRNGSTFGGELDQTTGCFHLSNLHQVRLSPIYLSIHPSILSSATSQPMTLYPIIIQTNSLCH